MIEDTHYTLDFVFCRSSFDLYVHEVKKKHSCHATKNWNGNAILTKFLSKGYHLLFSEMGLHISVTLSYLHSCSKVMGFFLRWQNMVFIFKVQTWNFVCGIRRSFAFTMENILSVWYTATPGWTSKFGKVWKSRCQNAATRANIWRCFLRFMRWQILMSDGQQ